MRVVHYLRFVFIGVRVGPCHFKFVILHTEAYFFRKAWVDWVPVLLCLIAWGHARHTAGYDLNTYLKYIFVSFPARYHSEYLVERTEYQISVWIFEYSGSIDYVTSGYEGLLINQSKMKHIIVQKWSHFIIIIFISPESMEFHFKLKSTIKSPIGESGFLEFWHSVTIEILQSSPRSKKLRTVDCQMAGDPSLL